MAAHDYGWFPTAKCHEFLGVSYTYFKKEIRPRVPAECQDREGAQANGPLWYLGKAVYEAAASRTGAVAARAADREASEGDPMLAGGDSPGLERFRMARAKIAELDLQERELFLIPRDKVHDGLGRLATILRGAGESLQRQFGKEAQDIIDEALGDFDRERADTFGDV